MTACLLSLGQLQIQQGEYDEAEEVLTRALGIQRRELGELHPDVASTRIALGIALHYSGRFDEVERLFERAAATYRQRPDAVTTDYAHAVRMLADIAIVRRQYEKADGYVREALDVFERLYGADHPETANMWGTAAGLEERRGNLHAAAELDYRALAILRALPQPRPADQAGILRNLARLLLAQGRAVEAEAAARQAVRLSRQVEEPFRVAGSLRRLGDALRDQERYIEARQAFDEILEELASRIPEGHSEIALTHLSYGVLAGREGSWEEAESHQRRALELYAPLASADSPRLATIRLELARALIALEQEDEARNVLDRALPVLVSTFGEADERVRDGRALRARARRSR